MASNRGRRTREELESVIKDVEYEWWMARESAKRTGAEGAQVCVNMALESFLIHARAIRDFFKSKGGQPDDIRAHDFLCKHMSVHMPLLQNRELGSRIDKRIAHLSYSRSHLERNFPVAELLREINAAMMKFEQRLQAVDPDLADILADAQKRPASSFGVCRG